VLDAVRWLMGDEKFQGEITSEADVPITHTRKQDVIWFYSTIFLVPALVVGLGLIVTRRRRGPAAGRGPKSPPSSASPPAGPSAESEGAAPPTAPENKEGGAS
jgi:hypothetical protein